MVAEGACVVAGGWRLWLWGACVAVGGMRGCGGHVWLLGGMCGCREGMHGCGGACMVAGGMVVACIGYDEIRSMSGRYTSYWNAFLSSERLVHDLD